HGGVLPLGGHGRTLARRAPRPGDTHGAARVARPGYPRTSTHSMITGAHTPGESMSQPYGDPNQPAQPEPQPQADQAQPPVEQAQPPVEQPETLPAQPEGR